MDARSCTALLRLQYCKISGVGLLPLQGSEVLQFLDLRQAHGPSQSVSQSVTTTLLAGSS